MIVDTNHFYFEFCDIECLSRRLRQFFYVWNKMDETDNKRIEKDSLRSIPRIEAYF